jgi:cytochrome c1
MTRLVFFSLFGLLPVSHGADLERGRTLYSQICFNCHGPKLEGGQGPALADSYWQHGSSPEAILAIINKGVPGSAMIGYEAVFSEADRLALRDFILSEQEGQLEVLRSTYPRDYFKGKRFTPDLFDSVESLAQTPLPENLYYLERNVDAVLRGNSKLYIKKAGEYRFTVAPVGRTSIFLDGEEVHYSDEATDKATHINKAFNLEPGAYDLEVFHEEKTTHKYRFKAELKGPGATQIALTGSSLEGSVPRVIKAGPFAKVVRKSIEGLPPRALLCLLPNHVIVAYDPVDAGVIGAWHSAEINQTPSLPDRSNKPSEINGTPLAGVDSGVQQALAGSRRFQRYEVGGEAVRLVFRVDGEEQVVTIAPQGTDSFSLSVAADDSQPAG